MIKDEISIDLIGLGKIAKAIPSSVYERTSETINSTFEKIIAPITETTSGLGRYIRQKFDNMVEIEKSILVYSIQNAIDKLNKSGKRVEQISSPKSLIRIMDNVSQETDPLLNVLWTNLLCSQLSNQKSHPFFINTLSSLSAKEALLLESLNPFDKIGEVAKNIIIFQKDIEFWVKRNKEEKFIWDFSCNLLCEFGLAETITPATHIKSDSTVILFRTKIGEEFLNAVKT